ncbi:MAG: biotin/lipoyl-binding protein, partial [Anaerolineaceae bacterium]
MKSRILKTISMIVAIIFILSACSTEKTNTLSASGTFSAIETDIASEISGKVLEVGVNEGDEIKTGQTLFKVDAEIIQAQFDQAAAVVKAAEAAVDVATKQAASADAQYQLVLQNALLQEQPNKQENWGTSAPEDYQPAWYFDKTELIAAAQAGVKNAEEALATALADLEKEQKDASSKDFISTENRLAVAQNEL